MKCMKWFLVALIVVASLVVGCASDGDDDDDNSGSDCLADGKKALELKDIDLAEEKFYCAVKNEPKSAVTNFWYAGVRILNLIDNPALQEMVRAFDIKSNFRLWSFKYDYPRRELGETLPDDSPEFDALIEALDSEVLPEVLGALKNLEHVVNEEDINEVVTAAMRSTQTFGVKALEVDHADVNLAHTFLYSILMGIEILHAYHLDIDIDRYFNDPCLDYGSAIENESSLMTFKNDGEERYTDAQEYFIQANNYLRLYLQTVLVETDNQLNDLTLVSELEQQEMEYYLDRFSRSMQEPTRIDFPIGEIWSSKYADYVDAHWFPTYPAVMHAERFFTNPLDRSLLPEISFDTEKCRNKVSDGTFPDPTLNALFPEFNQTTIIEFGNMVFRNMDQLFEDPYGMFD